MMDPTTTISGLLEINIRSLSWHIALLTNSIAELDYPGIQKNGKQVERAIWAIRATYPEDSEEEKYLCEMLKLSEVLQTSFEGDILFEIGIDITRIYDDRDKKEVYLNYLGKLTTLMEKINFAEIEDKEPNTDTVDVLFKYLPQERDAVTRSFYCDTIREHLIKYIHHIKSVPTDVVLAETKKHIIKDLQGTIDKVNRIKSEDKDAMRNTMINDAYSLFGDVLTFGILLETSRKAEEEGGTGEFSLDELHELYVGRGTKKATPPSDSTSKNIRITGYLQFLLDGEHTSKDNSLSRAVFIDHFKSTISDASLRGDITYLKDKGFILKDSKVGQAYFRISPTGIQYLRKN